MCRCPLQVETAFDPSGSSVPRERWLNGRILPSRWALSSWLQLWREIAVYSYKVAGKEVMLIPCCCRDAGVWWQGWEAQWRGPQGLSCPTARLWDVLSRKELTATGRGANRAENRLVPLGKSSKGKNPEMPTTVTMWAAVVHTFHPGADQRERIRACCSLCSALQLIEFMCRVQALKLGHLWKR